MRFALFAGNDGAALGIVDGGEIIHLSGNAGAPATVKDLIAGYDPAVLASARGTDRKPLDAVRLLPPVPDTAKLVCIGLNYAEHAKEGGHTIPDYPSLFLRVHSSLIAHGEPMVIPRVSEMLDYEAELMIVIGPTCRYVSEDNALDHVFGYTIFNDGSLRDYQRRTAQWTAGKNFDGTGAVGPWLVTADELPAGADGLRIRSILNGDRILQDSNTSDMIFKVPRIVSLLSEIMTLEPGDMIATGTPSGVGHARTPQLWLKSGDRIAVDIEGIGRLENPVVAERDGGRL